MNELTVSPFALVIALASRYLTSWLRSAKWFGFINANSVGSMHIVNGVISTVLSTVTLFLSGSLQEADVKALLTVIFTSIMAFSGAKVAYDLEKEEKVIPEISIGSNKPIDVPSVPAE
jgi:hypothetical protein